MDDFLAKIPSPEEKHIQLIEVRDFFAEGKMQKSLFLRVPETDDANKIEGLHAYLVRIKPVLQELGITGIVLKLQPSTSN